MVDTDSIYSILLLWLRQIRSPFGVVQSTNECNSYFAVCRRHYSCWSSLFIPVLNVTINWSPASPDHLPVANYSGHMMSKLNYKVSNLKSIWANATVDQGLVVNGLKILWELEKIMKRKLLLLLLFCVSVYVYVRRVCEMGQNFGKKYANHTDTNGS